jgi:uncharacterized peroxidase-related enzyme
MEKTMTNINVLDESKASTKQKELLEAVKQKLGFVPNMMKTLANSPAALESYLVFSGALNKGTLSAKEREQIALLVSELNECEYCVAAHSVIGAKLGLTKDEILNSRRAQGSSPRVNALLNLSAMLVKKNGCICKDTVSSAKTAGLTDEEIMETIAVVSLNIFTNMVNKAADTTVDFPQAEKLEGKSCSNCC